MSIILHSNDTHGIVAATIIKYIDKDAVMIKSGYRSPPKGLTDNRIYVIGMFYSKTILKNLATQHSLFVYSNNVGVIKDCNELINEGSSIKGLRDASKSPALSIWEDLYPDTDVPKLIQYVNDYHIWKFDIEHTRAFMTGLREYSNKAITKSDIWKLLIQDNDKLLSTIITSGDSILRYEDTLNEELCNDLAFFTTLDKHNALCMNTRQNSRLLSNHRLADKVELFICYERVATSYKVSLYSNSDKLDVGFIARHYNGGGHKSVASFNCSTLPFKLNKIKRNEAFDDMDNIYTTPYLKSETLKKRSFTIQKYAHNRETKSALINHFYLTIWDEPAICINTYSQDISIFYPFDYMYESIGIAYIYTNRGNYRYTVCCTNPNYKLDTLHDNLGGELKHNKLIFYSDTNLIIE